MQAPQENVDALVGGLVCFGLGFAWVLFGLAGWSWYISCKIENRAQVPKVFPGVAF